MKHRDETFRDTVRSRWAARYYGLIAGLSTISVSAVVAWLLDLDLKAVVVMAAALIVQGLGSAIPTERNVYSQETHEEVVQGEQHQASQREAQINDRLDSSVEEWEDALESVDGLIGHHGG